MRYFRLLMATPLIALAACSGQSETTPSGGTTAASAPPAAALSMDELIAKAKAEGRVNSVACPTLGPTGKKPGPI